MARDAEDSGESWFAQTGSISVPASSDSGTVPAATVASGTRSASAPRRARYARLWRPASLILLLLGPVLGGIAYRMADAYATARLEEESGKALSDRGIALGDQVSALAEILHSCQALYDASEVVERAEFGVFTRQALARHPAIAFLAWAPRVRSEERAVHEKVMREEGFPDYTVRRRSFAGQAPQDAPPPFHYPLAFAEPEARRDDLLGLDLAVDPAARLAIHRCADSEEATLTDAFPLPGGGHGALLVLAVHDRRGDDRPASRSGLGPPFLGVVVAGISCDELLRAVQRGVRDAHAEQMAVELLGPAGGRTRRLAPSDRPVDPPSVSCPVPERTRSFGGQTWTLRGYPTDRFLRRHQVLDPALLALGVLLIWELLVGCLVGLATAWRTHALRHQGRRVQFVLRSLVEGVVVVDPEGRVRLSNEAARRLLGADLHGLGAGALAPEGRLYLADGTTPCPPERLPLLRAIRGESVDPEEFLLRATPESKGRWLGVTARPLRDDAERPQGAVMVLRDVTARKRAEEHVRRLSNAVEQTADAVFITDPDGRIEYVNPAFERVTGYAGPEVTGRSPRFLRAEADADDLCESLWGTVREGRVFRGLLRNRRKDGTIYFAEHTITPVKDATGRFRQAVAVCRDMTENLKARERDVELRLAAQVQEKLFPREAPDVPGLDLAGAVMPASATCGDYFDYVTLPDGSLAIAIGDVSGHGLGPALVMAETRALVRALLGAGLGVSEVLRQVNRHLSEDLAPGLFVTLLLVVIEPGTRRMRYGSAGHTPGFLLGPDGIVKATLTSTGVPLGMFPRSAYQVSAVPPVERGDVLLLMTDGAPESPSADGGMLEEEGVLDVVRRHRGGGAAEILRQLQRGIEAFSGPLARRDDITLVVAKAGEAPDPRSTLAVPSTRALSPAR